MEMLLRLDDIVESDELLGEEVQVGWSGCVAGRWAACVCSCRRREASAVGLAIGSDLWARRGLESVAHVAKV
jgi:hypothetical protein